MSKLKGGEIMKEIFIKLMIKLKRELAKIDQGERSMRSNEVSIAIEHIEKAFKVLGIKDKGGE